MRKTLNIVITLCIILTLILGNVSVLASNIINTLPEENINDVNSDTQNLSVDQQTTENEPIEDNNTVVEQETDNQVAEEQDSNVQTEPEQEPSTSQSLMTFNSNSNGPKTISNGSGKIDIKLDLRLPSSKADFSLKLKQDGVYIDKEPDEPFESDADQQKRTDTTLYYTFSKLPEGIYTIEISHPGYSTYTQDVEVKANTISNISLTNGFYNLLKKTQVGLMPLGDVNSDGKITGYNQNGEGEDSTDEAEMISAISKGLTDSKYDLNGDNVVDIIDLSYISNNKSKEQIAAVLESVDATNSVVAIDQNTNQIETHGTFQDILLNNDKYVTLQPKNTELDICEDNAVEISIDLGQNIQAETKEITISPSDNPDNNIEGGTIIVETDNKIIEATIETSTIRTYSPVVDISTIDKVSAKIESDGTISVDLKDKVAVKKVTIRVTATKSNKFADIAKVEFLNGNIERIAAPEIISPNIIEVQTTGESFTVIWENMQNVTGYEVRIRAQSKKEGEVTKEYSVDGNSLTISDFGGAVKDNIPCTYHVAVQSVNGEWRSGYGEVKDVLVDAVKAPDKPDNVTTKGGVREIKVSWKKMNATDYYHVFIRKYENNEDDVNYTEVTAGMKYTDTSYTITNLEDNQKYQIYVVGENKVGSSPRSNVAIGETTSIEPAVMPEYKLINRSNGYGQLTTHIKSAVLRSWRDTANMVDSPLDVDENGEPKAVQGGYSALGVVDDSYDSHLYVSDWDFGGFYHNYSQKGIEVTFDKAYKINTFAFAQIENLGEFIDAKIWYKDMTTGKIVGPIDAAQIVTKKGVGTERQYTTVKLPEPIESDTIQITVGRRYPYISKITIAELRFYEYDSIEDDINNLYADQMHTTIRSDVKEQDFIDLQTRLNTKDEMCDEYHPDKDSLQKELDLAKLIFDTENLKDVVKIDTTVTKAKDSHITFRSGLNAWQPLGVVAHSNEVIKVFVGNPNKKSGESTNLNLIATQYYPEAAHWTAEVRKGLKVGLNEITIPKIDSLDKESGGSLYIEYTGNNPSEIYGVRVVGGDYIPVLDLSKFDETDEVNRKAAVKAYVQELTEVVPNLPSAHEKHKASGASELNYEYDEKKCILGATEIVLKQMMYSVSSKQILTGLGEGTVDEKADRLYKSLVAMEDMVDLFYQHKGLNKDTTNRDTNTYPSSRLNIRYHQMFGGAAMYAGGLHIGIDWGDVPTLSKGNPITTESVNNKDGKYVDGNYFGWGISHEIGHIINESAYVHGEVTNNYFSVLSQAQDTNASVRFQYPEVYKKVMSGKTGKAQNVFTQLGLYWQLHLAYDKDGFNFKTYDNYDMQQANLLFARMDSYARNTKLAPTAEGERGIALTLTNSPDDNLIRLACAAAKKNLLEFFTKWGMEPNEETINYAKQWEAETRAIYFINDEARAYELAGKPQMTEGTVIKAEREIVKETDVKNSNKVRLTIKNTNEQPDAMLGYEIVRTYMDNDKEIEVPVAFVTMEKEQEGTLVYEDTIETVNNRVFTYKITGYDKYLNKTAQLVLDPIKVEHDGTLGGKEDWTITTNLTSTEDQEKVDKNSNIFESTDGPVTVKADTKLIDGDYDTDYKGTITIDSKTKKPIADKVEFTIEIPKNTKLVGFKYTSVEGIELEDYTVEVSSDGHKWETVKEVKPNKSIFNIIASLFTQKSEKATNITNTVYFGNGDSLEVHEVTYVKFTINASEVSIAEIDLIGQTGDNVDFMKDAEGNYTGYGILQNEVVLGKSDVTGKVVTIPAESIVFTGTYKGNPAYNVLKLWNQDNELMAGSEQTFYADPVPDGGELTDVVDGIWIYWFEKEIYMDDEGNQVDEGEGTLTENPYYSMLLKEMEGKTLRAELYRTDDAETLEGERITSDSYRIPVSSSLPNIILNTDATIQ